MITGGTPDLKFIQSRTRFGGGYSAGSQQVQWLWQVLEEEGPDVLAAWMRFVTGSARHPVPLPGSDPSYTIKVCRVAGGLLCCRAFLTRCSFLPQISQGTDVAALPAAATCFNTMRLPKYPSKAVLRKKVVLAALECSGFAFS